MSTRKTVDELARELEQAHMAVVDATREFLDGLSVGKRTRVAIEVKVPGYMLADLADTVQEWKDAGEALVKAQRVAS